MLLFFSCEFKKQSFCSDSCVVFGTELLVSHDNRNDMEEEDGLVPEFLGESWHFSMACSPGDPQSFPVPQ